MTMELFDDIDMHARNEPIAPGATLLRGYARDDAAALLDALDGVTRQAPFRRMVTPGGLTMSVAMTNCGAFGWVSDRRGYRYAAVDPEGGRPWPALPASFRRLAQDAASAAGHAAFEPDACLVKR